MDELAVPLQDKIVKKLSNRMMQYCLKVVIAMLIITTVDNTQCCLYNTSVYCTYFTQSNLNTSHHSHCTRFGNEVSALKSITASIIQGSTVGPVSYVITASDLHRAVE